MILLAVGVFLVMLASMGLQLAQPSPVVWLAGVICVGLGWIDLRLGERE